MWYSRGLARSRRERRHSALGSVAAGADHGGVHIDRYEFGTLVADGRQIHSDVLLTPGRVHEHWWRREGHVLHLEDLGPLLDGHPGRLIAGPALTGACGPPLDLSRNWRRAA
jgi:hypothetical protein